MIHLSRRKFLASASGLCGLSLAQVMMLRERASASANSVSFGRARRAIVFFAWGGMSQLETWDPKPDAPIEFRGAFDPIPTSVPGIRIGEHLPRMARHAHRLTIVRSIHHNESGHRNAAYWNLTGHAPHRPGNDEAIMPSRADWPSLGATVGKFRRSAPGLPSNFAIPYMIADRGLVNGQTSGFLGAEFEPVVIGPEGGTPYQGVSPPGSAASFRLPGDLSINRVAQRVQLRTAVETRPWNGRGIDHYRQIAGDLLTSPRVSAAFDLDRETATVRAAYGDHICGRSTLLARRLLEAGVPIVLVYPGSGDLNGGSGEMWDTHSDNFNRLRNRLLPPIDRASSALLDDLDQRGLLDKTLVVWLTEFGRTPRINSAAGRDHFPNCYSVALAGAGIRGGFVYGRSDRTASTPTDLACAPPDLHATIFHALGIPLDSHIHDHLGRPYTVTDGSPLGIFS
jgi:hypothetical protein